MILNVNQYGHLKTNLMIFFSRVKDEILSEIIVNELVEMSFVKSRMKTVNANKSDVAVIEVKLRNSGVNDSQDLRCSVRETRESRW